MEFYTIGYGGRKPDAFIQLLKKFQIKSVADVRLYPQKAYLPNYELKKESNMGIRSLLLQNQIEYSHFKELGNIFMNDPLWKEKYRNHLNELRTKINSGFNSLLKPFCLLCAEKYAANCHRLIIAEFLESIGQKAYHIEDESFNGSLFV